MKSFRLIRHLNTPNILAPTADAVIRLPFFMEFYRPVIEITENSIASIVQFTGLPWWLSISILTVAVRTSNLPLLILQYRAMAPLSTAIPSYRLLGDVLYNSKASRFEKLSASITSTRQINKTYKTTFAKAFVYGLLQVPQFLTFVWGVRSLCSRNTDLKTGGILWFTDLTASDPYIILPVVAIGLTYMNLQYGVTQENKDFIVNKIKYIVQIWLIITLPISCNWPAGVFCYWIANSIFTLVQSIIFSIPNVMNKINPDLQKNYAKIFAKNINKDEAIRLTNLINTGVEGYAKIPEADLEKFVKTYLKEHEILSKLSKVNK